MNKSERARALMLAARDNDKAAFLALGGSERLWATDAQECRKRFGWA